MAANMLKDLASLKLQWKKLFWVSVFLWVAS